jgi:hypothetical protein
VAKNNSEADGVSVSTTDREKIAELIVRAEKLKKQANAKFNNGDFTAARTLYTLGIQSMAKLEHRFGPKEAEMLSNRHSNRAVTFFGENNFICRDDPVSNEDGIWKQWNTLQRPRKRKHWYRNEHLFMPWSDANVRKHGCCHRKMPRLGRCGPIFFIALDIHRSCAPRGARKIIILAASSRVSTNGHITRSRAPLQQQYLAAPTSLNTQKPIKSPICNCRYHHHQ